MLCSMVCRLCRCVWLQVIEPVRSRCLCIRVAAPTYPEVEHMLSYVAQKEGLKLPDPLRQRIAQTSDRNLRRALLCFETCKMAQYSFTDVQPALTSDWELYIQVCQLPALKRSPFCQLTEVLPVLLANARYLLGMPCHIGKTALRMFSSSLVKACRWYALPCMLITSMLMVAMAKPFNVPG